jgi:CMP-N,N'-diacetyllegionaminic acid synthase
MEKRIIAVIPARGGSKGLPRKNIQKFCGKPLISYTIKAALDSKYVTEVVVSTEDEEIATISEKFGADIFIRPANLANDIVSASDVVINVGESLCKRSVPPDILIMLQPTSPLRTSRDIDNSVSLFIENECESVISVIKEEHPPFWCLKIVDKCLEPMFGYEYFKIPRQQIPDCYKPNGAIFIATLETLRLNKGFYCRNTIPYIMPVERSVDIDSEIDFTIAQFLHEGAKNAE